MTTSRWLFSTLIAHFQLGITVPVSLSPQQSAPTAGTIPTPSSPPLQTLTLLLMYSE